MQEQLSNLWLLWEELQVQLPQLQDLLNHLGGQMMEMQLRHQEVKWQHRRWSSLQRSNSFRTPHSVSIQNTQYLQAQISGGITVDNWPGQSPALMQQLDHLRWTNDKLFRETLGDSWCGNQVRLTNTTHSHRPYTGSKITGQLHKNHKNTSEVIVFIKSSIYEASFSPSLRCGVSRCLR